MIPESEGSPMRAEILTRAFTTRDGVIPTFAPIGKANRVADIDGDVLAFDTETTNDIHQLVKIGTWALYRNRREVERGIFYNTDPAAMTKAEIADVKAWAAERSADRIAQGLEPITCVKMKRFIFGRLYPLCKKQNPKYGNAQPPGIIVFANGGFDLGGIVSDWKPASNQKRGGFFLGGMDLGITWDAKAQNGEAVKRRISFLVRKADAGKAFFGLGGAGIGVDVLTLNKALTSTFEGLDAVAKRWKTPTQKREAKQFGLIEPEFLDYALDDPIVTAECFFKLCEELERHPIGLGPEKAYSEASIGKKYYEAMGITPLLERSDIPFEDLGKWFSTYYGGWTFANIVRTPVPIVKLDALSMYTSVFVLLGLWPIVTAERITEHDATDEVRAFLEAVTYESMLDPATWKLLGCRVLTKPEDDLLPVRTTYGDRTSSNIGINRLASDRPMWYTLLDLVHAKLRGGTVPTVIEARRVVAHGHASTLRPVKLRGTIDVDPAAIDFMREVIHLRKSPDPNQKPGEPKSEEKKSFEQFLKILASSTSYGVTGETNRDDRLVPQVLEYSRKRHAYVATMRDRERAVSDLAEAMRAESVVGDEEIRATLTHRGKGHVRPSYAWVKKRWRIAGEYADVPRAFLDLSKRPTEPPWHMTGLVARIDGNLDDLTSQLGMTGDELLRWMETHRSEPRASAFHAEATNRLAETWEPIEEPIRPSKLERIYGLETFESSIQYPEPPGKYFFPPLASLITAGARLMLAMMQLAIERRGGCVAYGDTDSVFVVSTKRRSLVPCVAGPFRKRDGRSAVKALSWAEVDEARTELARLIPYDRSIVGDHLFQLEDENFALGADGAIDKSRRTQLYGLMHAEKKYALFNMRAGVPVLRDFTDHGLGHVLSATPGKGKENARWRREAWQAVIDSHYGLRDPRHLFEHLPWIGNAALGRLTNSSPYLSAIYPKLRPFAFMLRASGGREIGGTMYVAPFDRQTQNFATFDWRNPITGNTLAEEFPEIHELMRSGELCPFQTYRSLLAGWSKATVAKALAHDGSRVTAATTGLLRPMHVIASRFVSVGKESSFKTQPEDEQRDILLADFGVTVQDQRFEHHDELSLVREKLRLGATPDPHEYETVWATVREAGIRRVARESSLRPQTVRHICAGVSQPERRTTIRIIDSLIAARNALGQGEGRGASRSALSLSATRGSGNVRSPRTYPGCSIRTV